MADTQPGPDGARERPYPRRHRLYESGGASRTAPRLAAARVPRGATRRPVVLSRSEDPEVRLQQLQHLAYRVVYRLVGERHTARAVARAAVDAATTTETPGTIVGTDEAGVVAEALELVVRQRSQLGPFFPTDVPDADHRARLRRELGRWEPRSRLVLALRHLADMEPHRVAALVSMDEAEVRRITGTWTPEDAAGLAGWEGGLDTWVGSTFAVQRGIRPSLIHLDDPNDTPAPHG